MSGSNNSDLTLPTITLPPQQARHLRALIYASAPGTLITRLSLSDAPTQTITLTPQTNALPLHHPPEPGTPPNKQFLNIFPLSVKLSFNNALLTFSTTLPYLKSNLSPAQPLSPDSLTETAQSVLLQTDNSTKTHGLLTLHAGRYDPVTSAVRRTDEVVVGAWGSGDDVFVTAGLLLYARYIYRRCNRRLGGGRSVRKQMVLITFSEGAVSIRRGSVMVDGTRRWVCHVPLAGGRGVFRMDQGKRVVKLNPRERRDRGREGEGMDAGEDVENGSGEGEMGEGEMGEEEEEEEFMVAKMRELSFGAGDGCDDDDGPVGVVVTGDAVEVEEQVSELYPRLRVQDVDLEALNETNTTESSSDSSDEETKLEALCKQYLQHGYGEGVQRELTRLNTQNDV